MIVNGVELMDGKTCDDVTQTTWPNSQMQKFKHNPISLTLTWRDRDRQIFNAFEYSVDSYVL